MPKPISEYDLKNVIKLQPLVHAIKSFRYAKIDRKFVGSRARSNNAEQVADGIRNAKVLLTVAFEDPVTLELHLKLCRKFVPFDKHIVADNSLNVQTVERNRQIVEACGGEHIWLPPNPWATKRNASRSHGAAMKWLWHNILKPGEPKAFGFLDHDLFPTKADDPFALLADHDFYGDQRTAGSRWFLWAGYCFFKFEAIKDKDLDFGLDWFAGLDTGGANWSVLYQHVDRLTLPQRPITAFSAIEGGDPSRAYFEWRGSWIHEVGVATDPSYRRAKRAALLARLTPFLD